MGQRHLLLQAVSGKQVPQIELYIFGAGCIAIA